jgi:hypothetical protein
LALRMDGLVGAKIGKKNENNYVAPRRGCKPSGGLTV